MKITQITVECKKSANYQTFGCCLSATLESGEDVTASVKRLQATARKHVVEEIELEKRK